MEDIEGNKEPRPWGNFTVIHEEDGFKIKIIEVQPSRRLSYQSHGRRKERWVIVEGIAEITIEGEIFTRESGETVEIELGQKHRLSNPGVSLLRLIEVQIGDYLGEDDIIRFEDDFGRVSGN